MARLPSVRALQRELARLMEMRQPLEGAPTRAFIPALGRDTTAATPNPMLRAIAHDYALSTGREFSPPTRWARVDPERATRIATAYDEMEHAPTDRLVSAAWRQMGDETLDQLDALIDRGYKFEFNPKGKDPYAASPRLALEDLRENKHLYIFPTADGYGSLSEISDQPLLREVRGFGKRAFGGEPFVQNDAFRVVHDALGHAPIGAGFRATGEENAFRHHRAMYSDLAALGMTAETRGQNSWVNFGPYAKQNFGASGADTTYADQKAGILPEWVYNEGVEDFAKPISLAELRRRIAALLLFVGAGSGVVSGPTRRSEREDRRAA